MLYSCWIKCHCIFTDSFLLGGTSQEFDAVDILRRRLHQKIEESRGQVHVQVGQKYWNWLKCRRIVKCLNVNMLNHLTSGDSSTKNKTSVITYDLLLNTKENTLKNMVNRRVSGSHWLQSYYFFHIMDVSGYQQQFVWPHSIEYLCVCVC